LNSAGVGVRVANDDGDDGDDDNAAAAIFLSPVESIDCEAEGTRKRPEADCDDVELAPPLLLLLLRPPSLCREPVLLPVLVLVRGSLLIWSIGSFLLARAFDGIQCRARLL